MLNKFKRLMADIFNTRPAEDPIAITPGQNLEITLREIRALQDAGLDVPPALASLKVVQEKIVSIHCQVKRNTRQHRRRKPLKDALPNLRAEELRLGIVLKATRS